MIMGNVPRCTWAGLMFWALVMAGLLIWVITR